MQPDLQEKAHAAWFLYSWKRLPFAGALGLGGLLVSLVLLTIISKSAAERWLPGDKKKFQSFAPPKVRESENAAILWREAFSLYAEWKGPYSNSPEALSFRGKKSELYASGSSLRLHLQANASALATANRAAQRPKANFGLDYSDDQTIFQSGNHEHLGHFRAFTRLYRLRALLAAEENDWAEVERCLHGIKNSTQHLCSDPLLMQCLVSNAMVGYFSNVPIGVLSTPNARPTSKNIQRLMNIVKEMIKEVPSFSVAIESESQFWAVYLSRNATSSWRRFNLAKPPVPFGQNPNLLLYLPVRVLWKRNAKQIALLTRKMEKNQESRPRSYKISSVTKLATYLKEELFGFQVDVISRGFFKGILGSRAWLRQSLIGLALYKFRLLNNDWPESLNELNLQKIHLLDPFGKPKNNFKYKVNADNSVSVWSAVSDEGGGDNYRFKLDAFPIRKNKPSSASPASIRGKK